ncbi:MAG: glutamate 5-kinase [Planctomycetales bacterium]|nr:glutamate 5-kinase [Planctomycetales bacterium]
MENANRQTLLNGAETIVVKVGSRVLSGPDGCLDTAQVRSLSTQLAALADGGHQVVLVSSGAVASGMGRLGLKQRPSDLARLQAVAAVGQAHLIQTYESYFSTLGRHAAQILLIADDLDHRTRYLNVRNTLLALLQLGVIPIINENDTVAVDELLTTFGDNDRLAAMVAGLFSRPALIILSDVEGVYNMDPSNPQAKVLHTIDQIDQSIFDLAINRTTGISKGGMASKLKAAQFVTQSGVPVIIAGGRVENVLTRLVAGEVLGTLFLPNQRGMAPKKRWIGFSAQASGTLSVDAGAARAIRSGGPSLLAIGIVQVSGEFVKGEVLSVVDELGVEIARGLTNFSSQELTKIRGQRSLAIAELLGHCPYEEVIHRDNMTIIG